MGRICAFEGPLALGFKPCGGFRGASGVAEGNGGHGGRVLHLVFAMFPFSDLGASGVLGPLEPGVGRIRGGTAGIEQTGGSAGAGQCEKQKSNRARSAQRITLSLASIHLMAEEKKILSSIFE